MNLQTLLQLYRDDERTADIIENITGQKPILLKRCIGSAPAFVISALFQKKDFTHVFIANTNEDALYLQNDFR